MSEPMRPEDLRRHLAASDACLDAAAGRVLFTVRSVEGDSYHRTLWQAPLGGKGEAAPLPALASQEAWHPSLGPAGQIAFLSGKPVALWLARADGSGAHPLWAPAGGVQTAVWAQAPNAGGWGFLAVTQEGAAPDPSVRGLLPPAGDVRVLTRLHYKADTVGLLAPPLQRLHWVTVDGTARPLGTCHQALRSPRLSPNGRDVAFCATSGEGLEQKAQIWLLDLERGEERLLLEQAGSMDQLAWSPDGRHLTWVGHLGEPLDVAQDDLWCMAIADPSAAWRLTADFDRSLGNHVRSDSRLGPADSGPLWSARSQALYFLASDHGSCRVFRARWQGEGRAALIEAVTPQFQGVVQSFALADDDRLLFLAATTRHPDDLYLLPADTAFPALPEPASWLTAPVEPENALPACRRLTHLNPWLRERQVVAAQPFQYDSADGQQLDGWIMLPPGQGPFPVALQIHGGPHGAYGYSYFHQFQCFVARGWAVLFTNPRGSQSYGHRFAADVVGNWGNRDYTDIMSGLDTALTRFPLDAARLGVTGLSYGGYMTNWIVTHTQRFRVAVTEGCISNLVSFFGASDIGYGWGEREFAGTPWRNVEHLWDRSPLKYAAAVRTPTLIIHDEEDHRCPMEQGEQFYVALRRLGVPTALVRYPGEPHAMYSSGRPSHRIDRLERILAWFGAWGLTD